MGNVLSLFDGMGGGLTALKRLGVRIDKYYTSEVEQDAMDLVQANHSHDVNIIHLGDIRGIDRDKEPWPN